MEGPHRLGWEPAPFGPRPHGAALPARVLEPAARRFEARLHRSLDALEPRWQALEDAGACTVYQRLAWVRGIVAHLAGAGAEPLFVEVWERDGTAAAMIWPLVAVRRWGCVIIRWLDLGVSDYAAPLADPSLDLSVADVGAVWLAVKSALPRADLVDIARIPRDLAGGTNPLVHLPGLVPSVFHASHIILEGAPETLLKRTLTRSMQRGLAKADNRLTRRGAVAFVVADTEAMVTSLFDALMAQRRARFKELGRFDLLARPEVEAFYRAAARDNLSNGFVRLFGLSVDGEWVATSFCLCDRHAAHGILLTMAGGEWRKLTPGLKIAAENIVWARRQGLALFDLTIGDLTYKDKLGGATKDIFDLQEALSRRGAALLAVRRLVAGAKAWVEARPALFARLKAGRQALRRLGA